MDYLGLSVEQGWGACYTAPPITTKFQGEKGMNNMELARFNMVEQQIRPWDVLDANVLDLIKKIDAQISMREY